MPGGPTPFGIRVANQPPLAIHRAADFPGGRHLTGPTGAVFTPHGPKNVVMALWLRLDSKAAQQNIMVVQDTPVSAATDIYGIFYDPVADAISAYTSNGVAYKNVSSGFSPTMGLWYLVWAEFGGAAFSITVVKPDGTQQGGSTATGGAYPSPPTPRLGIGSNVDANAPLSGALDSVQMWNDVNTGDFPTYFDTPGDIWHGGKALEFTELPASAPPQSKLQLYLDFNEPTGASSYKDKSQNAFSLTPSGSGVITRILGAGYGS
jgi:Concanavalin A-like lectin/glucanases superfamily